MGRTLNRELIDLGCTLGSVTWQSCDFGQIICLLSASNFPCLKEETAHMVPKVPSWCDFLQLSSEPRLTESAPSVSEVPCPARFLVGSLASLLYNLLQGQQLPSVSEERSQAPLHPGSITGLIFLRRQELKINCAWFPDQSVPSVPHKRQQGQVNIGLWRLLGPDAGVGAHVGIWPVGWLHSECCFQNRNGTCFRPEHCGWSWFSDHKSLVVTIFPGLSCDPV